MHNFAVIPSDFPQAFVSSGRKRLHLVPDPPQLQHLIPILGDEPLVVKNDFLRILAALPQTRILVIALGCGDGVRTLQEWF